MKKTVLTLAAILAAATLSACASKAGNISTAEAKKIALENAGVAEDAVSGYEVDLETEAGITFYDISFDCGGYEYEYEVMADSGEIIRTKRELDDDSRLPTPTEKDDTHYVPEDESKAPDVTEPAPQAEGEVPDVPETQPAAGEPVPDTENAPADSVPNAPAASEIEYIGAEKAGSIALDSAGYAKSDVYDFECELDTEHGTVVYDVSFDADGYDYDFEIDAVTGYVHHSGKEPDPDHHEEEHHEEEHHDDEHHSGATANTNGTQTGAQDNAAPSSSSGYITSEAAASAALKHAGYTADEVYSLESELDRERGVTVYDVSFEVDGYDFDYEIDASSGDILRSDKERDYDAPSGKKTDDSTEYISRDKAKEIAFTHSGVAESNATKIEVELDYERGKAVYDVSFDSAGYEYDYEIDAVSGEIIRSDRERD